MRSQLQIESLDKSLLVRIRASIDLLRIVLTLMGGAFFIFFLLRSDLSRQPGMLVLAVLFVAFLILKEIIAAARGTNVELTVRNLDFVSTGHAPGGYVPCQVSRDDLLRLEFRHESGGGDDTEYPSGLYVEYNRDSAYDTRVCVLPGITEEQTKEVIDAIRRQFPEIDRITFPRPAKSGLISLNLNSQHPQRVDSLTCTLKNSPHAIQRQN
jgi:hypothetical protein